MEISGFLLLGLGAGLVHALDPDHVAAVSGMRSATRRSASELSLALHWALGHSAAILVIAVLVFAAGVVIPPALETVAMSMVAASLIAVGVAGLRSSARAEPMTSRWNLRASLIGLLHGGAGSAPLLALIPVSLSEQPEWALVHVLLFNLGVVVAMLGLGLALRASLVALVPPGSTLRAWPHSALAMISLLLGCYLLLSAPLRFALS